jgi:hypothetical protein
MTTKTTRLGYSDKMAQAIQNREDFKNHQGNFRGENSSETGGYLIYSYEKIIASYDGGNWFISDEYVSQTTARQINFVKEALGM